MALVKVYRGLHNSRFLWHEGPELTHEGVDVNSGPLGIHWTSDPIVAYNFAHKLPPLNTTFSPSTPMKSHTEVDDHQNPIDYVTRGPATTSGVVLEGYVNPKHIVNPKSDEWDALSRVAGKQIYLPGHEEQEVTIRYGSPVRIVRQHLLGPQFDGLHIVEHPRSIRGIA